jgi:peptide/nickel transport system permease protein
MAVERPRQEEAAPKTVFEPPAATRPAGPVVTRAGRAQRWGELARALLRSKTFVVGAAIVLFWVLDALLWRFLVPYEPNAINPEASLLPLQDRGPSTDHWFGTDDLGRDVLSRVLAGASSVLTIAPLATALGLAGGIVVG